MESLTSSQAWNIFIRKLFLFLRQSVIFLFSQKI